MMYRESEANMDGHAAKPQKLHHHHSRRVHTSNKDDGAMATPPTSTSTSASRRCKDKSHHRTHIQGNIDKPLTIMDKRSFPSSSPPLPQATPTSTMTLRYHSMRLMTPKSTSSGSEEWTATRQSSDAPQDISTAMCRHGGFPYL